MLYVDYPVEEKRDQLSDGSLEPAEEDNPVRDDGEPNDSDINNSVPHDGAEDNNHNMEKKFNPITQS